MTMSVVDTPYSWVIATCCSLMYFVMYGLSRASGLMFVATLDTYDTDRATASFPFTLACAVRYLGGPLAGYFANKFGIRLVILLGCFLASIGVGVCSVTENLITVAIFWGVLYGLGSGLSGSQLPQMNNLYFRKHLTKANGLSQAGAAVAGIVLPPLVEILLDEYGIKGTYLLLFGYALHSIPVGMLMREPPKDIRDLENHIIDTCFEEKNVYTLRKTSYISDCGNLGNSMKNSVTKTAVKEKYCIQNIGVIKNTRSLSLPKASEICNKDLLFSQLNRRYTCSTITSVEYFKEKVEDNVFSIKQRKLSKTDNMGRETISELPTPESTSTYIDEHTSSSTFFKNKENSQRNSIYLVYLHENKTDKEGRLGVFDIFLDIRFLLISFTGSINVFYTFVLPTIINDFALDKGISLKDSTYMLMAMSVTDLLGRIGFAWVTDSGLMSLANLCALCFLSMAFSFAFVVWWDGVIVLYIVLGVMGLFLGIHTTLPPCLITKYIAPERHTMANASVNVLSVPFLLLTSSMIGHFRDEMGSYDWLVYILSIISIICCIMMLILPHIEKWKIEDSLQYFEK